ncbi:MAG: hypothetical protein J6Z03_08695, partial [Erysipelotrichaceae bacterium]|nr:hypothetical protein [Erysipelotrichaceae bacterium]
EWTEGDLIPSVSPRHLNPLEVFTGWYLDEGCTIPYRGQTYSELANYDYDVLSVTLYAGWYDRGIIRYTAQVHTKVGDDDLSYNIKENGDWYLLLSEYNIIGGDDADMFRMSLDKKSIIISDEAQPGTYNVIVSPDLEAILNYLNIEPDLIYESDLLDSFNLFEILRLMKVDIPENIQEIVESFGELSQTILIEWTVEEAADDGTGPLGTTSVGDGLTADPVEGSDPTVGQDGDENDQVDAQGSGQSVDETVPGTDDDNVNPLTNSVGANNDLVVNTNQQNVGTEETEEEEQNDSSQVTDNGGIDVTIPETVNGEGGEENTNNPETVEGE